MHEIALFILSFVPFRWPDMNIGIGYLQVCVKVTNNFASVQVVGLFSKITNQLAICIFSYQSIIGRINDLGAVSIRKTVLPGVAIPMLKIRRPNGRLIFNIGIAIPR